MIKYGLLVVFTALAVGNPVYVFAEETFWNLPQELSDVNTDVRFEVDSTWHMVHGVSKNVNGRVWLEDPADYSSIKSEIQFPVASFDTDNSSRDSKMRRVMAEPAYADVSFALDRVNGICFPEEVKAKKSCAVKLVGKLTIRGMTKSVTIPARLEHQGTRYRLTGETSLDWSDYGVEDPSIFIARLDKIVSIHFSVTL